MSSREHPNRFIICADTFSTSAAGKSTLLITGMIVKSCSKAKYTFASVCACIPCVASTTSTAVSTACKLRDTSYEKSTCPGVSIKFSVYPFHCIVTGASFIVIPFSRSSSIESSSCAFISRFSTVPVSSIILSAIVDFPWSICAIIQKFRIFSISLIISKKPILFYHKHFKHAKRQGLAFFALPN